MSGGHIPVLVAEVLELLAPRPGEVVLDGTVGGGGHARVLLERVQPGGRLIGLDCDAAALEKSASGFPEDPAQCILRHANFADLEAVLETLGVPAVDLALLDLGASSFQFDDPARGFAFQHDGLLDMRMDRSEPTTAADLVNQLGEKELADLIYRYGEERHSRRIAALVVAARRRAPITTTGQLARLVLAARPARLRGRHQRIHPATRVFQALRIGVNRELENLEKFCDVVPRCLRPGGRVAIISFHSLEDRIVKQSFRRWAAAGVLELVTKKAVQPSAEERRANPRSRSAKLRVARRTEQAQPS